MQNLNDNNFYLYAAANYTSMHHDTEEFNEELKRFKYLKRLFFRYAENGELRERLILNHLITLYNIFEYRAVTRMLFLKIDYRHWSILKTFLIYLSYMPDIIYEIDEHDVIKSSDIPVDVNIVRILRKL